MNQQTRTVQSHITFAALPHQPLDERLEPQHLRDWRYLIGQLRHARHNFHYIICGSRDTERELAEIAAKTFVSAQICSDWADVGNAAERHAHRRVLGNIMSFMEHSPANRKTALVLEYPEGIPPTNGRAIRPGSCVTCRCIDDQVLNKTFTTFERSTRPTL